MGVLNLKDEELKSAVYEALKDKIHSAINYVELHKMIDGVIEERQPEFDKLLNNMFDSFFKDADVQAAMLDEFKHKVAKTMIAKLDGAVEKNINKFRQDPATNARLILAVEKIITEAESKNSSDS